MEQQRPASATLASMGTPSLDALISMNVPTIFVGKTLFVSTQLEATTAGASQTSKETPLRSASHNSL
jgi:hypothetical protein